MNGRGRPLRFLALVGTGWIGVRVLMLWPASGSLPEAIRQAVPFAARPAPASHLDVRPSQAAGLGRLEARRERRAPAVVEVFPAALPAPHPPAPLRRFRAVDPRAVQAAYVTSFHFGRPIPVGPVAVMQANPSSLPVHGRWSGTAWLVARGGTGLGVAPGGGQLGGGQAGLRIAYALRGDRRLALVGRLTTPLAGAGREAALGIEWQPTRLPVRLVAEQRLAIGGGSGGPAVGVLGGGEWRSPGGFRLETYAQAGAIARARVEPYIDGAARLSRPVASFGAARVALGAGAWGAAQRDAARLDLGPSAVVSLPLAGRNFRVALDWRQRIASDARPGSGLTLTLGSDF